MNETQKSSQWEVSNHLNAHFELHKQRNYTSPWSHNTKTKKRASSVFLCVNLKLAYLLDSNANSEVTTVVNTGMKKCSSACTWRLWRCNAVWQTWGCPAAHASTRSCPHCPTGTFLFRRTAAESHPSAWINRIAISSFPRSHGVSKIGKKISSCCKK